MDFGQILPKDLLSFQSNLKAYLMQICWESLADSVDKTGAAVSDVDGKEDAENKETNTVSDEDGKEDVENEETKDVGMDG